MWVLEGESGSEENAGGVKCEGVKELVEDGSVLFFGMVLFRCC